MEGLTGIDSPSPSLTALTVYWWEVGCSHLVKSSEWLGSHFLPGWPPQTSPSLPSKPVYVTLLVFLFAGYWQPREIFFKFCLFVCLFFKSHTVPVFLWLFIVLQYQLLNTNFLAKFHKMINQKCCMANIKSLNFFSEIICTLSLQVPECHLETASHPSSHHPRISWKGTE